MFRAVEQRPINYIWVVQNFFKCAFYSASFCLVEFEWTVLCSCIFYFFNDILLLLLLKDAAQIIDIYIILMNKIMFIPTRSLF